MSPSILRIRCPTEYFYLTGFFILGSGPLQEIRARLILDERLGNQRRLEDLKASLCAVLVSQACNIGYRPLVRSNVAALTRERLNFVAANYVRTETLEAANARLVEHHAVQPLTANLNRTAVRSVDG